MADGLHLQADAERPLRGWLTTVNATVARLGMFASVAGLFMIVAIVFFQVFGPLRVEQLADLDRKPGPGAGCSTSR